MGRICIWWCGVECQEDFKCLPSPPSLTSFCLLCCLCPPAWPPNCPTSQIYFVGQPKLSPPAPALEPCSPKEEQPGGICILIAATLLQTGCPGCRSRGDVAAVGDRDAADGALVPVSARLMGGGGGGGGAADPAPHLCIPGTASCIPRTAALHARHCITAALALHCCIALAAASMTGMLQGSKAGTHIVLSPWSVGQQEPSRLSCSQGAFLHHYSISPMWLRSRGVPAAGLALVSLLQTSLHAYFSQVK